MRSDLEATRGEGRGAVPIAYLAVGGRVWLDQGERMVEVRKEGGGVDWRLAFVEDHHHDVISEKPFSLPLQRK